ncbi:MAG: T9SS type A sorting domain-containing protein, partial [Owenweeksia sp.]
KIYSLFSRSSACTTGVAVGNVGNCVRCIQDMQVGLEEIDNGQDFYIYPNPSEGRFTVHSPLLQKARVSVYNSSGQPVYEGRSEGQSELKLQLERAAGLYLLIIDSKDGTLRKKFSIR